VVNEGLLALFANKKDTIWYDAKSR